MYQKILLIFIPLILGLTIGFFFKPSKEWNELQKSRFLPPSYVFSIVWTILYLLIGFILYRTYKDTLILSILIINMCFNLAFTPIQFGLNNLKLSLLFLIFTIITTIYLAFELFRKQYFIELYATIPYITWLIIALLLQIDTIILNKNK